MKSNIHPIVYLSVVVIFTTAALQIIDQFFPSTPLAYSSGLFLTHFYWQWITPSLVHVNWMHWILNILNFLALLLLFRDVLTIRKTLILFSISSLCIMISLYMFSDDVNNYVGMSGVLYTLAVYGAVKSIMQQKIISILILLYIVIKLIANDWTNHLMMVDTALSNMNVITDVHWYGSIIGIIWLVLEKVIQESKTLHSASS